MVGPCIQTEMQRDGDMCTPHPDGHVNSAGVVVEGMGVRAARFRAFCIRRQYLVNANCTWYRAHVSMFKAQNPSGAVHPGMCTGMFGNIRTRNWCAWYSMMA